MKILIFIHSLGGGGAERVTAHMSSWWAARGHEVTIATMAASGSCYEIDPRVRIVGLDVAGQSRGQLTAMLGNLRRLTAMRRLLREVRPDCAIGMMTTEAVLLPLAAAMTPVRTVGSERIYPPAHPIKPIWEALRKIAYRHLDALVMQTEDGADWARGLGVEAVHVVPNPRVWPLPPAVSAVDPAIAIRAGRQVLISAGRMLGQKDFPALLRIFASLAAQHGDWDLVILGDGPDRAGLEDMAKTLGLADRVFLPGRVGNIGDWFAAASLFALTSRFEGFPNVLLEARAAALPVVSFDCKTGPGEILTEGVDAFLIPPGDEARFAAALDGLMADEGRRTAMGGAQGKARRFDIDCVMAQWSAVVGADPLPKS